MEFEELQKIWDAQNNQALYVIDEKGLHNRIESKRKQARHITNVSELLLIIVNFISSGFILGMNLFKQGENLSLYFSAAWMFGSGLYMLVSRIRRLKGDHQFDRSMRGDLDHAISVATYQVRISQLMRWNIVPIAAFSLLGLYEGSKAIWISVVVLIFFAIAYYASGWEHGIYIKRKRELELLKKKLENEG